MNNRRCNLHLAFAVLLAAATAFLVAPVHAADTKSDSSSLAASAPPGSDQGANSSTSAPRKDGLKQLEDDIFKPFKKQLSPQSSLDGVLAPPQTRLSNKNPVPQTRKEKEKEA